MDGMKIGIRVDASQTIGMGQVFRCLTLAEKLREQGAEVFFLTQELTGHANERICQQGFTVIPIATLTAVPADSLLKDELFDWLIVDHYQLDAEWESSCRAVARRILVIDDLANRPHDCDVLLDQNALPNQQTRYQGLVSVQTRQLLGLDYALLRPEFQTLRKTVVSRTSSLKRFGVKRLMISLGGANPGAATTTVLTGLGQLGLKQKGITGTVMIGAANPAPEPVKKQAKALGFEVMHPCTNLAEQMLRHDLFVGAGGTSTWERMALGLPGVMVSIDGHHHETNAYLAEQGAHVYLGHSEALMPESIAQAVGALCDDPNRLQALSENSMAMVDAQGADRVCQMLYSFKF